MVTVYTGSSLISWNVLLGRLKGVVGGWREVGNSLLVGRLASKSFIVEGLVRRLGGVVGGCKAFLVGRLASKSFPVEGLVRRLGGLVGGCIAFLLGRLASKSSKSFVGEGLGGRLEETTSPIPPAS